MRDIASTSTADHSSSFVEVVEQSKAISAAALRARTVNADFNIWKA